VVEGVEVDVIALEPGRRGDTVAFCEVKTRSTTEFGLPSESLGHEQRTRLRRAAGAWMRRHGSRFKGARCRLDLVEVIVTDTEVKGRVLKDAF
jgi:putative endonuclease